MICKNNNIINCEGWLCYELARRYSKINKICGKSHGGGANC